MARQARLGGAWQGEAWHGLAGQARLGMAWDFLQGNRSPFRRPHFN